MSRISWDDYFLSFLDPISKRATCNRGKSAAIIVKDNRILSTGYVGSPPGLDHCDDVGHDFVEVIEDGIKSQHCIRTMHAESNAISQAAKVGISLNNSTIYCTMEPCRNCAMLIASVGIKRVVCLYRYQKAVRSRKIFKQCNIELICINDKNMDYIDD